MTLAGYALSVFHQHATIHEKLDRIDRMYRDLLQKIEVREIESFGNDTRFAALEDLKRELLEIKFV